MDRDTEHCSLAAACALRPATAIAQGECLTDPIGDLSEADDALRSSTRHTTKSDRIGSQMVPSLIPNLHGAYDSAAAS